jgi:DNA topoisomerase 2-associated protein PAT1
MPPEQHVNMNNLRRRPESEYMSADEIESILRIQWRTLHNGPPYLEDYYYQVRYETSLRTGSTSTTQFAITTVGGDSLHARQSLAGSLTLSVLLLQAFLHKHYGQRNARHFAPHTLREAAPGERAGPAVAANFVQLEGLGKIPFSNVRRPKPLMDVSAEVRVSCVTRV